MFPVVSIIVPLYNRRELVMETIQSVIDQSYPYWELIIIDDGSTDGSESIVKEYADRDGRIHVYSRHREPKGAPTCRNIGIEKSMGEYIVFLDSDDLLAPFCIEKRLEGFKVNPEADFLVFPTAVFTKTTDDANNLWNSLNKGSLSDLDRCLSTDTPWQTTSVIWKKSALKKTGFWMEDALCRQDLEFHVRALTINLHYVKCNEVYDNFYRDVSSARISRSEFKSEKYLISKSVVFQKLHQILIEKGQINDLREGYLAEYYFENAFASYLYNLKLSPFYFIKPLWKLEQVAFVRKLRIRLFLSLLISIDAMLGRRASWKFHILAKKILLPRELRRERYQKKVPIPEAMKHAFLSLTGKQAIS